MTETNFSLREKKHAKTKIALAEAFIEKLRQKRFSEISIKEVCESVDVSEGTFYNYFPQKSDMIKYFNSLRLLRVEWEASRQKGRLSPLEIIELAFKSLAGIIDQPYLFYEIISVFTSERLRPQKEDLTPAEKFYSFPDCPGIENCVIESLDSFFLKYLRQAEEQGLLGEDVDIKDLAIMLKTVLIGTPLAIEIEDFKELPEIYRKQLEQLRKAFGVKNEV